MVDITDRTRDAAADGARKLAVRAQLALEDASHRAGAGLAARARALRAEGERGAQAAEYAMLGGVSAACCTVVINVINNNQDLFSQLLGTVFGTLGRAVGRWF